MNRRWIILVLVLIIMIELAIGAGRRPSRFRIVPPRIIPVPETVSPQLQAKIRLPLPGGSGSPPSNADQWRRQVSEGAKAAVLGVDALKRKYDVTVTPEVIAGVRCFMVTPKRVRPQNVNRLLVNLHGGAYVYMPGEAGLGEAVQMAGLGGFRVISIDYRMPPDHPYPAAVDDAIAVWRQLVTEVRPANMGVFGTSAGGALTLSLIQRAKAEHLPLPAVIAPGTPWADLTKTGDSYYTNQRIDNVAVQLEGTLTAAAHLYAGRLSLRDPRVSPIYGDFRGFPPAILTTGTRDLFLSNTVRTHRKLREAGVEAQLEVFEGMSHSDYLDDYMPESIEAVTEIINFFDRHLGTER